MALSPLAPLVPVPMGVLAWAERPRVAVEAADWARLGAVPELARWERSLRACSWDDSQAHSVPVELKAPPSVAHSG